MDTHEDLTGVLVIDKPAGITSHDVVARIRRVLGTRKVGHLGTLDPMATGVLPLTIGKATRLAQFIPKSPKIYTGRIRFGQDTSTCDADGDPIGEQRPVELDTDQISAAMDDFRGIIQQIPPVFSAKKVSGVRAHRLARRGVEVEMKPIEVQIESFERTAWNPPDLDFHVVCSPGTYVRSLARDLGSALGTGGHLSRLRRMQSGVFTVTDAVGPDQAGPADILPPHRVLEHLPRIDVEAAGEELVRHGRPVPNGDAIGEDGSDLCIFNKRGELIAIASRNEGWANPKVVLL